MIKIFPFLLLAIFSYLLTNAQLSDSCNHYTFQKLYTLDHCSNIHITDLVESPDGTTVVVGDVDNSTPFTTTHIAALIMKIKRNGDVLWIKKVGGNWVDRFQHIKRTLDGGYIAVGVSQSYGGPIIVKFDSNGNIMWARKIIDIQQSSSIIDITTVSDGGYALSGQNNNGGVDRLISIVKMDSIGHTIWSKALYSSSSGAPGGILEEGDSLVLSGICHNPIGPYVNYHTITKINKYTGNIYWSKRWTGGTERSQLIKMNNYYYVSQKFDQSGITRQQVITKLDVNGNIVKCSYLSDIQNYPYLGDVDAFGVTHDNELIISRIYDKLNLAKVSPAGLVRWANQYPPNISSSAFNAIKELSNNDIIAAGTTGGQVIIDCITPTGLTGGCQPTSFNSSEITISITSEPFIWSESNSTVYNNPVDPPISNITYSITTSCSSIRNCDSLKLSGLDSACINTDTINYSVHRNAGCFATVQFTVDPTRATILSRTDTTAKIIFLQPGSVKVYSSIVNTCGTLKDSVTVTVRNCNPSPDTCSNFTYQNLYHSATGEACKILDVIHTRDRGSLAIGQSGTRAMIMKVNSRGDVKWAKTIGAGTQDDKFRNVKQTSDGGYITIGASNSFGQLNYSMFLVKLDSLGSLTWARSVGSLGTTSPLDVRPCTILQTSDGGYAINGYNNNVNKSTVIIRTDAAGNTLWHKYFNMANAVSPSTAGGIIEENDSLVFSAECPDTTAPIGRESLTKINKNTGVVYWAKRWAGGASYSDLHKATSFYYVSHLGIDHIHQAISKIDLNGNIFRSFYLTDGLPTTWTNLTCVTHDNGILVSRYSYSANLTKVGANDQVQWANLYSPTSYIQSVKETPNNQIITAGFSGQNIVLTKGNANGSQGNCPVVPVNSGEGIFNITSQLFDWTQITQDSLFNNVLVTPITTNLIFNVTNQCSSATTCDSLKLIGIDSACINSDTITYSARRGVNCFSTVQFRLDPVSGNIISSTDSSVRILFHQPGNVKLYAFIVNACDTLKDSIIIRVFDVPPPVYLGPDTTLCPNTSITLRAGPGFRSYQWQNGSTDSNLVVTTPGLYYVTAINHCGFISRDSINIGFALPQFLDAGNDTSKCNTDSLTLTATSGFSSYSWTPNYNIINRTTSSVKVWPAVDTIYRVSAFTSLGCLSKDSIRISVYHSNPLNIGNDTSFCKGNLIILDAGAGFVSYLWNTGATTQQIIADSAKRYIVTATNIHVCRSRDSLTILSLYSNPVINLQKDSTLCDGSSLVLNAGVGYATYLWQDSSKAQKFTVNRVGKYWVTVIDAHQCRGSDTSQMMRILPLPSGFIYKDTAICEFQTITLKPSTTYSSYLWSTGARSNQLNITAAGTYWLEVTNSAGCTARQNVNVATKNCIKAVYFPNAFTPNGDGLNDNFKATVFGPLKSFHLVIFNRFGEKIFEGRDYTKGWDGKFKGQDIGVGTFVWYSEYQFINGAVQTQRGSIILFR